jgi:hypothetical protein
VAAPDGLYLSVAAPEGLYLSVAAPDGLYLSVAALDGVHLGIQELSQLTWKKFEVLKNSTNKIPFRGQKLNLQKGAYRCFMADRFFLRHLLVFIWI